MQTAKIIPLQHAPKHRSRTRLQAKHIEVEWLYPGRVIPLAPEIDMGIAYDQVDGLYVLRFKFWHARAHINDLHLNKNNQIDLRTSCGRIITLISNKCNPHTDRPEKTLIEVAHVPFSWQQ